MREKERMDAVDVTNNEEMVREGIRVPDLKPRDQSLWSKTAKERAEWKQHRRVKPPMYNWPAPDKSINLPGLLVIYTRGMNAMVYNRKRKTLMPKNTFSHKCIVSDIQYLLNKYVSDTSEVIKYSWNGKTYAPGNLPFTARK